MRFSWRVMSREKNGSVTLTATSPKQARTWIVSPGQYLTGLQEREMATQPDLIWQLARHIGEQLKQTGVDDVEVRADAWVSLNGRPAARLVDPAVDLMQVQDDLRPKPWILPAPETEPIHLKPLAVR
jgi:hypothetical protein